MTRRVLVKDEVSVVSDDERHGAATTLQAESGAAVRDDLISVRDVSFTYDTGVQALGGITLDVPRGKITGIVGPSGCGKSTLLRLIAGLMDPGAGTADVRLGGPGAGHAISMVSQEDTLLPWLRVKDNVGLYFRYNRTPKAEVRSRVDELLGMVGLRQFADSYPRQLSGGMRRRVAFLTAVAPRPQLLLLDEPFSSVDEPTRVAIHQDIFDIICRQGTTAVLVTHDLAEAVSLSHQVLILSARPARVAQVINVPFGNDRRIAALREQTDFLDLYGELWSYLRVQIGDKAQTPD